jgi:hypothetical protein
MTSEWIFGWWNLVFLAPFALAMIYLFVYSVTGVTFGDAEHDTDFGHDVVDVDGELMRVDQTWKSTTTSMPTSICRDRRMRTSMQTLMRIDADADADRMPTTTRKPKATAMAADRRQSIFAAMTWLGIGRVPVSIVLLVLMLSWGAIGFCSNQVLRERIADPARIGLISIGGGAGRQLR